MQGALGMHYTFLHLHHSSDIYIIHVLLLSSLHKQQRLNVQCCHTYKCNNISFFSINATHDYKTFYYYIIQYHSIWQFDESYRPPTESIFPLYRSKWRAATFSSYVSNQTLMNLNFVNNIKIFNLEPCDVWIIRYKNPPDQNWCILFQSVFPSGRSPPQV